MVLPRPPTYNVTNIQLDGAGAGGFGTINTLAQTLLPIINKDIVSETSHLLNLHLSLKAAWMNQICPKKGVPLSGSPIKIGGVKP